MGKKGVTTNTFLYFFEDIQEWARFYRKPEDGYYLTKVGITDVPETNQILIEFTVVYGQPCIQLCDGSVNNDMEECTFGYLFNKDGSFVDYIGEEPKVQDNVLYPSRFVLPSFVDFPDPEDGELFDIIKGVIYKCDIFGTPLRSITFVTSSPSCYGELHSGIPAREDDAGQESSITGHYRGICLKQDMHEGLKYYYYFKNSVAVTGEYDLTFRVSEKDSKESIAHKVIMC